MNSNGVIEDSGDDAPQGFYLYMISPKTGNVVTIDFESGKFVEVTNSNVQIPVHTTTVPTITAGSGGTAIVSNRTIYYKNKDSNGDSIPNKYYWDSECT
jgi:argininosuccinate synthase